MTSVFYGPVIPNKLKLKNRGEKMTHVVVLKGLKVSLKEEKKQVATTTKKIEIVKKIVASFNAPRVITEKQIIANKKKADALIVKAKREADKVIANALKVREKQEKKEQREMLAADNKVIKVKKVATPKEKLTDEEKKQNRIDATLNRADAKLEASRKIYEKEFAKASIIHSPEEKKVLATAARLRRTEYLTAKRKYMQG